MVRGDVGEDVDGEGGEEVAGYGEGEHERAPAPVGEGVRAVRGELGEGVRVARRR